MTEGQDRDVWERARTVAILLVRPHVKKGAKLSPKQLISLPWDNEAQGHDKEIPRLAAEDRRQRFEDVVKRLCGRDAINHHHPTYR